MPEPINNSIQNYVTAGNIRLYGTPLAPITREEIQSIPRIDYTAEFHLLRHFSKLPDDYRAELTQQSYQSTLRRGQKRISHPITQEKIDSAMETIASKFNQEIPDFATPRTLTQSMLSRAEEAASYGQMVWLQRKDGKRIYLTIELPYNTGTGGIISVNSLSKEQLLKINLQQRSNLRNNQFIYVLPLDTKTSTNKVTVIIIQYKNDPTPSIATIYPGELVPPAPKHNQQPEEFSYNADFWRDKIFLV